MIISRRFFLIGASSVVATAAIAKVLPPQLLVPQTQFVSLPADGAAVRREVFELFMGTEPGPYGVSCLTVKRPEEKFERFHFGIHGNGSNLMWRSAPGEEEILMPGQMLTLDWPDCPPGGVLRLMYRDIFADGTYMMSMRTYEFNEGRHSSEANMMTQRKSLTADPADDDDDYGDDDDDYDSDLLFEDMYRSDLSDT